ncbi:hypothetical protein M3O96_12455 [Aquiflexum sp. TKW24L]|uniref:hypothetical protein n=1 Tax=Aquiflexum sp. TKW24L TaxID=2942212 RepID=UPI0020BFC1C7|nr:hypothetical protein [Aquiflexum sp. TKW24L]MCL6259907.1 hypothetical protein [Aquiflexum sp. TKW24L]
MINQHPIKPYLFQSAEIRWFLPPTLEWEVALEWFMGDDYKKTDPIADNISGKIFSNNIKREELRTDEYLIIPHCTSVGVKKRQGKLEVKAQIGTPEKYIHNSISGEINYWFKWSFQPSESNISIMKEDLNLSGEWFKIFKVRYLLKLSKVKNDIIEISPEEWPESGCQVELTQIWREGDLQKWTSFGFEAFGGSFQNMKENLTESILFFLSTRKKTSLILQTDNSVSYPEWIQNFK